MKFFKLIPGLLIAAVLAVCSVSVPNTAHAVTPTVQRCAKVDAGASVSANTTRSVTVVCPGVALGDACEVGAFNDVILLTISCYVSAANTVTILQSNVSAGAITAPNTTYTLQLFQWYKSP